MERDPNWLYSTLAQSTAALVAIVGGLLVSRLVALSGSRQQLNGRQREADHELGRVQDELLAVRRSIEETDERAFAESAFDPILDRAGAVTLAELIEDDEIDPRRADPDRLQRVVTDLSARVRPIASNVAALSPDQRATHPSGHPGLDWDPADEQIWVGLLKRRRRSFQSRPNLSGLLPDNFDTERLTSLVGGQDQQRHAGPTLEESERDWERQERAAKANVAFIARETTALADLPDLWEAARVLVFFAIAGMLFPMVLLAWDPVPAGLPVRIIALVAFTTGFGALVRYIIRAIKVMQAAA